MQRQFIFEVTVASFGILGIGCGTPFGKDTSSGIEVTRISPTPTSNTDASTLIPTLETNLTYGPEPKTYEVNATGQYNLALKLEKAGKLTEALPLYIKAAEQNVREAQYNLGYMYEYFILLLTAQKKAKVFSKEFPICWTSLPEPFTWNVLQG